MDNSDEARHTISLPTKTDKPKFFYGYIVASVSFLVLVVVWGTQYSFGVFFKPLLNEFGWTRAVTSGAYSLNMVLQGLFGIVAGRLSDRFGPKLVVVACGLFLGLGYLLMSQISAVWQIYLFYGVLASIGTACCWVPLMSTLARWFVKRRGLMTGIVASGVGAGTVLIPLLANQLISSYTWRTSYIFMGLIVMVVTLIAAQFLRRDPSQMGQLAYGADEPKTGSLNLGVQGFSLREAIRTRQFWIMSVALSLLCLCHQTVMVHIVPYTIDIGFSAIAAATILSILGGMSIIGKIGLGSAGDKVGNRSILAITSTLMLLAFLWLQLANDLWMLHQLFDNVGADHSSRACNQIVHGLFSCLSPSDSLR